MVGIPVKWLPSRQKLQHDNSKAVDVALQGILAGHIHLRGTISRTLIWSLQMFHFESTRRIELVCDVDVNHLRPTILLVVFNQQIIVGVPSWLNTLIYLTSKKAHEQITNSLPYILLNMFLGANLPWTLPGIQHLEQHLKVQHQKCEDWALCPVKYWMTWSSCELWMENKFHEDTYRKVCRVIMRCLPIEFH